MIPAGELQVMREELSLVMTEACTVKRPQSALDDDGYPQDAEMTIATDVACRIMRAGTRDREQLAAGEVQAAGGYTILMPHDTALQPQDIIESGSRRFHAVSGTEPQTDEIVLQVQAVEVNPSGVST